VDDGFVLAESQAILRYLADRDWHADLYPTALPERARKSSLT
jgi:glutathione S-transferase